MLAAAETWSCRRDYFLRRLPAARNHQQTVSYLCAIRGTATSVTSACRRAEHSQQGLSPLSVLRRIGDTRQRYTASLPLACVRPRIFSPPSLTCTHLGCSWRGFRLAVLFQLSAEDSLYTPIWGYSPVAAETRLRWRKERLRRRNQSNNNK